MNQILPKIKLLQGWEKRLFNIRPGDLIHKKGQAHYSTVLAILDRNKFITNSLVYGIKTMDGVDGTVSHTPSGFNSHSAHIAPGSSVLRAADSGECRGLIETPTAEILKGQWQVGSTNPPSQLPPGLVKFLEDLRKTKSIYWWPLCCVTNEAWLLEAYQNHPPTWWDEPLLGTPLELLPGLQSAREFAYGDFCSELNDHLSESLRSAISDWMAESGALGYDPDILIHLRENEIDVTNVDLESVFDEVFNTMGANATLYIYKDCSVNTDPSEGTKAMESDNNGHDVSVTNTLYRSGSRVAGLLMEGGGQALAGMSNEKALDIIYTALGDKVPESMKRPEAKLALLPLAPSFLLFLIEMAPLLNIQVPERAAKVGNMYAEFCIKDAGAQAARAGVTMAQGFGISQVFDLLLNMYVADGEKAISRGLLPDPDNTVPDILNQRTGVKAVK